MIWHAVLLAAALSSAPAIAEAAEAQVADVGTFARVVVAEAALRAGPGVSYRVIHRAHRGDTFAVEGREGAGFWLRVILPDGRVAYVLGDTVEPIAVDENAPDAPSKPGFFAPPALEEAHGGFSMMAGVLDRSGYAEIKPAFVLAPAIALEPFAGLALTRGGRQFVYGGGATLNIAPSWAIAPFVHLGFGAITTTVNEDNFAGKGGTRMLARAGGGLLISLRWRMLVRLEAMQNVLFDPNFNRSGQSYVGGLGTYF